MYNIYRSVGCSQEDHLPNCGHFGFTGGYLSEHLKECKAGRTGPCTCNPEARKSVVTREGLVSQEMMLHDVQQSGIELRGAGVDESSFCYKRLPEVLANHAATVDILHTLTPIGVAMAGSKEFDPYKD